MDVFGRKPINGTAGVVTGQSGCSDEIEMSTDNIKEQISQLEKRSYKIKQELGIKSRTQHKNLMYRFNKRGRKAGRFANPDLVAEYVQIGQSIQRLLKEMGGAK